MAIKKTPLIDPKRIAEPKQIDPPELDYLPRDPKRYRPPIGLIGCGGIATNHLRAYRKGNYHVAALCDVDRARAEALRDEFYPDAAVFDDYRKLLARDEIEVIDAATHPAERTAIVRAALEAKKHVLSQKPFVVDLDEGERLADLADQRGVRLAVNQNGRWAPHFSYIRAAIAAGLLGQRASVAMSVHWNHQWVRGTEFEKVKHLILYDFAIHWFDVIACIFAPKRASRVLASFAPAPGQTVRPNMMAQAIVEFDDAQATLAFDGAAPHGQSERTYVRGSIGSIECTGPDSKRQNLTLYLADGFARPALEGCWFPDGFRGTMGELLLAIEENREPSISARNNLDSLALCFAAVASAERHRPFAPGEIRRLP
jgi:predicted dehydrogenase